MTPDEGNWNPSDLIRSLQEHIFKYCFQISTAIQQPTHFVFQVSARHTACPVPFCLCQLCTFRSSNHICSMNQLTWKTWSNYFPCCCIQFIRLVLRSSVLWFRESQSHLVGTQPKVCLPRSLRVWGPRRRQDRASWRSLLFTNHCGKCSGFSFGDFEQFCLVLSFSLSKRHQWDNYITTRQQQSHFISLAGDRQDCKARFWLPNRFLLISEQSRGSRWSRGMNSKDKQIKIGCKQYFVDPSQSRILLIHSRLISLWARWFYSCHTTRKQHCELWISMVESW